MTQIYTIRIHMLLQFVFLLVPFGSFIVMYDLSSFKALYVHDLLLGLRGMLPTCASL